MAVPKFVQITREEVFWPCAGVHGERLIELRGWTRRSSPAASRARR